MQVNPRIYSKPMNMITEFHLLCWWLVDILYSAPASFLHHFCNDMHRSRNINISRNIKITWFFYVEVNDKAKSSNVSPETELMYEKIAPFVENDVFRSFECFNFATLELFKMLDIATFNIMNWTVDNFKNWTKAYRSYCAMHFETYAGNEMTAGDLLDWWETTRILWSSLEMT